ncbi:MAG: DEAD/DEAH box helicase [Candidatus Thorarchaeota archaeon]|nr:DEAD/DEAH box helicase [Candidatus Thorarchaeota archaeon]
MNVATGVPDYIQRMLHRIGITPRGIQNDAITKGLLDGQSVMVSSPTGSGKTLVAEMALLRAVMDGGRGVYLVPFRALAVQISQILQDHFEENNITIGLSTGDFDTDGEDLRQYDVIVTTYERADSLLRRNVSWMPEVSTIVIDEIQSLSEPIRGARLESFIIRLRMQVQNVQIVALSATVGAPDEIADWLDCHLVESNDRPVPLAFKIIQTKSKPQTIKQLVMTTIQGDGQVLVFHRTRREAETSAARLAPDCGRQFTTFEKAELDRELQSIENHSLDISPELRDMFRQGVAYHHAGLDHQSRMLVEKLFSKGMVRLICATTTLAAGMDLPARTVILSTTRAPANHQSAISANMAHQMLGRAGRPGYDSKGFGIILVGSTGESEEIRRKYFEDATPDASGAIQLIPVYERVQSVLASSESLSEQLLVFLNSLNEASLDEIEEIFIAESYLSYLGVRDTRAPLRLLQLGEIHAEHAIEKHALPDTVRPARQGVLGSVKIREENDAVIGGIISAWDAGGFTSRFSARVTSTGLVEGPQCSCSMPIDSRGILCPHLVALGIEASRALGELADYVIPIALSEISPCETLTRLGLIEGGESGRYRPTHLGRIANRLYLRIPTIREMLAILPSTQDSSGLLWLLRHLVSLETGSVLDDKFDHMIAAIATTDIPLNRLAREADLHDGDLYGLLETTRWLLYSLVAISELGGLENSMSLAANLLGSIDARFSVGRRNRTKMENEES